MGRRVRQLTAVKVNALKKKGLYPDGDGLYLQITGSGAKSWIYRFKMQNKTRDMGLGPLSTISLAKARELAAECRRHRLAGTDPIEWRKEKRAKQQLEVAKATTFDQARDQYIAAHSAGWRNEKHRAQWKNTLEAYATPIIGKVSVQDVDTALVMKILEPIWNSKTETASRVRGRIESILDWAKARALRTGENPALWRGHLQNLLPKRSKVSRVKHHPALPYEEMERFLALLRARSGTAALALEFTILTAARTGEALGAVFSEIDLKAKVWTVPPERMKGGRQHRVPLSDRAVVIVKEMAKTRLSDFIFPGQRPRKPLSNMSLLMLLRDMEYDHITVHGFRSSFRDWAAEKTNFAREVAEAALAHVVGDQVEAAYRRGDLFEKRRQLMDVWARHCDPVKGRRRAEPRLGAS
jgi:integrase